MVSKDKTWVSIFDCDGQHQQVHSDTLDGLADVDMGRIIDGDQVLAWIEFWGSASVDLRRLPFNNGTGRCGFEAIVAQRASQAQCGATCITDSNSSLHRFQRSGQTQKRACRVFAKAQYTLSSTSSMLQPDSG